MDEKDKKSLQTNRVQLREEMEPDEIANYLFAKGVFTDAIREDILSHRTGRQKNDALLNTLPKSGPTAFEEFCNALREGSKQPWLADKLEGKTGDVTDQGPTESNVDELSQELGGLSTTNRKSIDPKNIYALLVAGSDSNHEMSLLFCRDVDTVHAILTEPRIMGLRQGNVRRLLPNAEDGDRSTAENVTNAFKSLLQLSKDKDSTWIIFYYSGHSDGSGFKLNGNELLPASVVKTEMNNFHNAEELLAIIDCCYASRAECIQKGALYPVPNLTTTPADELHKSLDGRRSGIRQWSSSRASQPSLGNPTDNCSHFTEYIVRGLCSAQRPCITPNCAHCDSFRARSKPDGNIWLATLQMFVYDHVTKLCDIRYGNPHKQQPTMAGETSKDIRIAKYQSRQLYYWFDVKNGGKTYHLKLKNLPETWEDLKTIVQEKMRLNFEMTLPANAVIAFYNNTEALPDVAAIKQMFHASVRSVVTVRFDVK